MYDMDRLLEFTDMTMIEFQQICTLSCNDYTNVSKKKNFLYYTNLPLISQSCVKTRNYDTYNFI